MTTTTTTTVTYTWTAQGATWQCQGRPCVVCGDELATSEPTETAKWDTFKRVEMAYRAKALLHTPLDERYHDDVRCIACYPLDEQDHGCATWCRRDRRCHACKED